MTIDSQGETMKRSEVFTPNTLPEVTFVGDHLAANTKLLQQSLEMGGGIVAISGPSKSGKTVFVEKTLGADNLIQVTGANVATAGALWRRIFDMIGTPLPTIKASATLSETLITGQGELGIPAVAKVAGTVAAKWAETDTSTSDVAPDYLNLLVRELKGTSYVVFIDDFHYIPKDVQAEIANVIKEAIREGIRFVLAAVPYHADDVVIANNDLRGRMLKLDFDYWTPAELAKIAVRGFKALNVNISVAMIDAFASEAAGSPQLMQSLCLNLCFETDIEETSKDTVTVQPSQSLVERVCKRTAQTNDYTSVIRAMKEGPKVRGQDRNSYLLKDGTIPDVYPIIVQAIAQNPPNLTITYPLLLGRIEQLCKNDGPKGSSVTGACEHISAIANSTAGASIIEWDETKDVLDIRDPYLLFAMRWSETK